MSSRTCPAAASSGRARTSAQEPKALDDDSAELMTMAAPSTAGLRDIGEASFGPLAAGAETVHGTDGREQITATSIYPWRATASLLITAADNSQWIGTAWFISPHTLATAGHCVCIKNSGVPGRDGFVKKILVMPGRNGTTLPYGSVTTTDVPLGEGLGRQRRGELRLRRDHPAGEPRQHHRLVRLRRLTRRRSGGKTVNIAGYPGDKPSGTLWYDSPEIASVNPRKVYYDIDTAGGQSGSGGLRIIDGNRYGVGDPRLWRRHDQLRHPHLKPVFDNLVAWKA